MKVIALNGSKRKMNTYAVLERIGKLLAKEGIELEIINLFDYRINECIGCMKCITKDTCVYETKDDMLQLMQKLKACDGVILASPVYLRQVSGRMKTFLDRTCKWYHRTEVCGKPSLFVATTAGSGLKSTLDYLEDVAYQWGMLPAGKIGIGMREWERPIEPKEIEKFVKLMREGTCKYKPTMKQLIDYELQKVLALKVLPPDKEYWLEQGWDKQDFYIECRIGWHKKLVAKSFYKLMYTVIKPKVEEDVKIAKE